MKSGFREMKITFPGRAFPGKSIYRILEHPKRIRYTLMNLYETYKNKSGF